MLQPQPQPSVPTPDQYENPFVWPIYNLLCNQSEGWKIHTLAAELSARKLLTRLDNDDYQHLFKTNFLIMNALYQLQNLLLPAQWLQVDAMNIRLQSAQEIGQANATLPYASDSLRDYYLDWQHYTLDSEEIQHLLTDFWARYATHQGLTTAPIASREDDLQAFGLSNNASAHDVRKRWRQLALKWHPDRPNGNAEQFRSLYVVWQRLRVSIPA
ncbi:DNA-J related domain-containing protein [Photobacterium ganghwense]|uniref:DNA-J related domain-containing protein n=1 Tax=Photobacterium ganghwense TaxID=320778 RepID=UPI004055A837